MLTIFIDHKYLWVFGPEAIQPYFNSGNFPFPYDVYEGGFIENGLGAVYSVCKLDNSIFWLGSDERGKDIVWRANGFTPQRVSTHAMEYEFSTYARTDDCVAFSYQWRGHTFLNLNFPTAEKTWVYDCATQLWHQEGYWEERGAVFTRHRAQYHTFNFGLHIVGDPTNGNVYAMDANVYNDNGNALRRVRVAPHLSNEMDRTFFTKLQVDAEVGTTTIKTTSPPTNYILADATGAKYKLQIDENGIIGAPPFQTTADPVTLFMNDSLNLTSWQLTINAFGVLQPVEVTYGFYPIAFPFVSALGQKNFTMQLFDLGSGIGVLQSMPQGDVVREHCAVDDGAARTMAERTFSTPDVRDCGAAGKATTRLIWNREGSAKG